MRGRRGALGRAGEIAGSVMAGVKRRQATRMPKVFLYDEDGRPRTLDPGSPAADSLVETARRMVAVAVPDELARDELAEEAEEE
jgi:hypothetical protein